MARGRTAKVLTQHFDGYRLARRPDELIVEEPLEIRLDGVLVNTTMRTPGHDFALATGFCFTEGLLAGAEVLRCRYCSTGSAMESAFNVVSVDTGGRAPPPRPRLTTSTSACGVCGITDIDDLTERLQPLPPSPAIPLDVLADIPDRIAGHQDLFDTTGGVHAAAAFTADGEPLVVREDIGRHNAVDKVVGHLLLDDALPATGLGMWVSGRASFEMVQKAWAAGFGTVVAVSAPSSLAVSAAQRAGLMLCGFARHGSLNVYAPGGHPDGAA